MSILSDRLNKCVTELGISQNEIARRIGATPAAVSMIFNGRVAKPRKWRELASALNIDEEEMVELMRLAAAEALGVARASRKEKAQKRSSVFHRICDGHRSDRCPDQDGG